MENDILGKAKGFFIAGNKPSPDPLAAELGEKTAESVGPLDSLLAVSAPSGEEEGSSSFSRALAGAVGGVGDYFFPVDLIGGCCPRVIGEEQDIAWNAAAEASDSERIHIIWHAKAERIWYLAVRSSEMSSHANTWCPFGSLMPGMKDAVDPPTIYTYYSDESATMMTVLPDGLQIHRGTSSVVRAKAERMSRELNNAPIIELVPDRIAKLTPIPWFSLSLFEDRARRILSSVSVAASLVFASLGVVVWFAAAMSTVSAHADLAEIEQRSKEKSLALLKSVQAQRASPMREQLAQFADVNDGLLALNGYLEIYQINNNKAQWRAVLPANVTSDRINDLGGKTLDNNALGVIVGSSMEALGLGKGK